VYKRRFPEAPFPFGRFRGQDMAGISLVSYDFSCPCDFKSFCGASIGFYLWHNILQYLSSKKNVSRCIPADRQKTSRFLPKQNEKGSKYVLIIWER
jgi:hypothetical protein